MSDAAAFAIAEAINTLAWCALMGAIIHGAFIAGSRK